MKTQLIIKTLIICALAISLSSCIDPKFEGYAIVKTVEKVESNSPQSGTYLYDVYCYPGELDGGNGGFHIYTNYQYEVGDTLMTRKQMLNKRFSSVDSCTIKLVAKNKTIDSLRNELAQKNTLLNFLMPQKTSNETNTGKGN